MAESATNDISEDVLPIPHRPDERLDSEIEANGVDDNTMELNSGEDSDLVMEELKGDSWLDERRPETSSVMSDISLPHDQWGFNRLLVKISQKISEKELEYMKEMYKNEIGRKVLESIDSALQLFDNMQKRLFLTPVNLLQLECLLWDLGRRDLLQLVIDYAQQTKNIVYMHPATDQPVNGYKHVKFHICGKDFTKMTTDELSHIRAVVAVLLGMPMKFVLINGVDPSTSVTVTLLLPNDHVKVLRSLLQDNVKDVIMLLHVGVDKITLDGHIYVVSDLNLLYESESDEETQRQVDLFEKYQEARKVVNLYEIENANLKQEIGDIETKLMALTREKNPSEQQDIVKALEKFSEALEHMKVHVKTTAKELRIFKPGCHS